jgi:hypothetical protein
MCFCENKLKGTCEKSIHDGSLVIPFRKLAFLLANYERDHISALLDFLHIEMSTLSYT